MRRRTTALSIFALVVLTGAALGAAEPLLRPPFVLNCGAGEGDRDDDRELDAPESGERDAGVRRLRDVRYGRGHGYGHEGGEGFRHWFAVGTTIWGRPERDLFASGRSSPESFRFDLPAGDYIVALGFCELEEHLAGRRVFDIALQGRAVRRGVDPFAVAGYGQSFRLAHAAEVRGREGLTVTLRRRAQSRRSPFVSAIWIAPLGSHRELEAPANVRGIGSYGLNAVFWDHAERPDIAGCLVERRASGDADYRALTPEPVPVARWIDPDVAARRTYEYRVRAVDIRGRRGPPSPPVSLVPRAPGESTFPVYALTLKSDDRAALYRDVHEDREVPATFSLDGKDYPVRVRIRGAVSRFAAKLSYRVTFLEASPFAPRRVIYIKAEPGDYTMQQTKLTCDVFAALGTPAGSAAYVNLLIDGRYQGVYLDVERIDRAFLERAGLSGTLFRAASFQRLGGDAGRKRGKTGSRSELPELIRAINRVDRGEFESLVRSRADWPALRDYLVASTVCHRSEIEANDSFYGHVAGERWILLPWDHNNGNFGVSGSRIRRPFMPLFGQTLQGSGHWNGYWHALPSRIFHQRRLRLEYLDRLERAAREWLVSGAVDRFIAANHAALRRELPLDPYRWPPGNDEPFERSANDLARFVRRHGARLLEAVGRERHRPGPPVVINEFQLGPRGGWVEIHNRGERGVPLDGFSLGSLDGAYRAWHRFGRGERLAPGGFRVVKVEYPPRLRLAMEDDDAEWLEALERAELEGREPPRREPAADGEPLPGGTVALVGWLPGPVGAPDPDGAGATRERDSVEDAEARERRERSDAEPALIDWYFFGHQTPGFSYGRVEAGFAFLKPTPGEANPAAGLEPPALLLDGGRRGHRGGPVLVAALIDASSSAPPPRSVTLHYSFGGPWRETPMEIEPGRARPRFVATVGTFPATTEISYYFVARSDEGIERRAPLTAPVETYRHAIRGDD